MSTETAQKGDWNATSYDKVADHGRAGAEYIVSADMSCLMHLKGCVERLGLETRCIHIAQILNGDETSVVHGWRSF